MKLARYLIDGQDSCGYVDGHDRVVDLGPTAATFARALERPAGPDGATPLERRVVGMDRLQWLPPVLPSSKVLCVGFNFQAHSTEVGTAVDTEPPPPTLFSRFPDTFVGHDQPVRRPRASEELDWEGELAVVIGRAAWQVGEHEALSFVGGYTCMAENSVRDWQQHGTQATAGKNFPGSGALGPYVVTADEVADPAGLELITRLNGDVVQRGAMGDLVFSIPQMIAYITTFTPLAPGDIIAMGTPSGTGFRRVPPRFLTPGDILEVQVDGVGSLRNGVISAPADPRHP